MSQRIAVGERAGERGSRIFRKRAPEAIPLSLTLSPDGKLQLVGASTSGERQGNRTLSLGFWIEFCIDGVPVKG
jgi:hypothetical protein